MVDYFIPEFLEDAKKQKRKTLIIYFIMLGVYLAVSVFDYVWYFGLPYKSPAITGVKWLQYSLTAVFVIFSFVYLGIVFKRVRRYYKQCYNMQTGLKETSTGNFLEYDEEIQDKDGVDFKSLVFIEWNKYKKDFFERKVLVFYEKPFPEIPEKANVRYVTQGNVLISYEILV